MKTREAANDGRIVRVSAVAVDFSKVFEEPLDKVEREGPIRMPCELHALKSSLRIFGLFGHRFLSGSRSYCRTCRRREAIPNYFTTEISQSRFDLDAPLDFQRRVRPNPHRQIISDRFDKNVAITRRALQNFLYFLTLSGLVW